MTTTINDWNDLDDVRNNLESDYVLASDLTPSMDSYAGVGDAWEPIGSGNFEDGGFAGEFDGNGHRIEGITVQEGAGSDQGLFEQISGGGHIHDLAVVDFNTEELNEFFVAPVAANNSGLIEDCIASGEFGRLISGGFVARNGFEGVIRRCVANSSLTGEGSSLSSCGGFVADNRSESSTIEDCYSVSTPKGEFAEFDGGFVGNIADGVVENCFFDLERAETDETRADTTPLTTAEMQARGPVDSMTGLDLVSEWSTVVEGVNADQDGYPILRTLPIDVQAGFQDATPTGVISLIANLSANVDDESPPATLSWDNNSAPPSVGVFRSSNESPTFPDDFNRIDSVGSTADAFSDASIINAGEYVYRVAAVDENDDIIAETNAESVTTTVPLEALAAEVVGETEPEVDLEWTVNYPTLDATRVYRAESHDEPFPGAFDEVLTLGGGVKTAVDETVAFDTSYGYRVVGIVGGTESDPTDETAVTVGEGPAFEIRILDTNTPVNAGDEVGVEVEIVNTGDFAKETDVELSVTEQ